MLPRSPYQVGMGVREKDLGNIISSGYGPRGKGFG